MFFYQLALFIMELVVDLLSFDETKLDANAFENLHSTSIFFTVCYVFCYVSENITAKALDNANIAYNATWYELPNNTQKAFIMIIMRSQESYRIIGLGMIDCSLEVFLKVIESFHLSVISRCLRNEHFFADYSNVNFVLPSSSSNEVKWRIRSQRLFTATVHVASRCFYSLKILQCSNVHLTRTSSKNNRGFVNILL